MVNKVSFPRIIAFFREDGTNVPDDAVAHLKAALKLGHAESKVILIYAATDLALSGLFQGWAGEGVESRAFAEGRLEMIESCDALVWIGEAREHEKLLGYAKTLGRQVCTVSRDGKIDGLDRIRPTTLPPIDGWLPSVFQAAGLSGEPDLETIFRKTDALASLAAPVTQRWFKWIIVMQALAVVVPVTWLMNRSIGLPTGGVAGLTLGTIVLLIATMWWFRWRGMQKMWARARLVAEVARSMLVMARCTGVRLRARVRGIASLKPLRWFPLPASALFQQGDWVERYIKDRIDGPENYFAQKQSSTETERRHLSRWATLFLDISLVFAVAGVVIYASSRVLEWTHMPGGSAIPIILALAGVICPLSLLLIELLRRLTELDRKTARYAQHRRILKDAKDRLSAAPSGQEAADIVEETERQLLAEVLEWFFQVDTAEHFFHFRHSREHASGVKLDPKVQRFPVVRKLGELLDHAGLFTVRVVLGRIVWAVIAGMAVLAWISYQHPTNPVSKSDIRTLAVIKDADGKPWIPSQERLENGCVIIVHGLWGRPENYKGDASTHWTRRMANAIQARLAQNAPDIAILDWHSAATPSEANQLNLGIGMINAAMDVAAIRPQAQEVGDYLSFRVAEMILDGTIHKDKPLHLIGDSAGGFVVSRVACRLKQLGIAPKQLRVTLLDTPMPDSEITADLGKAFPGSVDYYCTSPLTQFGPDAHFPGIELIRVATPSKMNIVQAHSYACEWYINTISLKGSTDGFSKSPLNRIGYNGSDR